MQTIFPVLATNPEDTVVSEAISWQLIHNLIECCLVENWVPSDRLTMTEVSQYPSSALQVYLTQSGIGDSSLTASHHLIVIKCNSDSDLLLLVEAGFCSNWRLSKPWFPLLASNGKQRVMPLTDAAELLGILLSMMDQSSLDSDGVAKLKQTLNASAQAMKLSSVSELASSTYSQQHWYQTLVAAEQWASLMDRPFHPLAKAKLALVESDYQKYMAEFNHTVDLVWVALAKTHLMTADAVEDIEQQNPASYLLNPSQYQALQQELKDKDLAGSHVAIPLHPWQSKHVLNEFFAEDLASGVLVQLNFTEYTSYASSSLRSMLPVDANCHSIKLPMGIHALNSKRYLPALKLINGEKNQAILMQAIGQDKTLAQRLKLWDERSWWGYMSPSHLTDKSSINPWFYQEKPTHLGAMLRTLPTELCNDRVKLLPMASLGMLTYNQGKSLHIFDEILAQVEQTNLNSLVLNSFNNLCDVFLGTMLHCLKMGFAPEMHGQNIVIVVEDGNFTSLLLRDHDSVRIHLPWLAQHNIADPEYLSPPDFKNRLYRDTPEQLIFYLQSLGISVNIRAIVESLSEHYNIPQHTLWLQVKQSVSSALREIDFDDQQRQVITEQLLQRQDYPHKTLLLPVIERGADPHGSMPAGESTTVNPLSQVSLGAL